MAGFQMHITTSTVLGVAYGGTALALFDVPLPTAVLATGLCSVSGMLPDLDSGPGRPLRESLAFAAAFVPMMMFDRARQLGWSQESMVLAGGLIYLGIRFGVGWMLRKYTVHRGMFHSLPAALLCGELAFLLCNTGELPIRYFKAASVLIGFMSHLVLDEIYSVERKGIGVRFKSSFGTAIKFWGKSTWANISTYSKLAIVTVLVFNDPIWSRVSPRGEQLHEIASKVVRGVDDHVTDIRAAAKEAAARRRSANELNAPEPADEGTVDRVEDGLERGDEFDSPQDSRTSRYPYRRENRY